MRTKSRMLSATLAAPLIAAVWPALAMEPTLNSAREKAAAEAMAAMPQAAASPEPTSSRIRVRYRQGPQAAAAGAPDVSVLVNQTGAAVVQSRTRQPDGSTEDLVLDRTVSEVELRRIADSVARSPAVEYAVPETFQTIQQVVNDPHYQEQWHYYQPSVAIRLPEAWKLSTGKGVVVAVLDTGIRKHVDLVDQTLPGYDMVDRLSTANDGDGRDADPADPGDWCNGRPSSWHGTHVAGTIAARTNNGAGVAGIAPEAKILPVRVLGTCGGSNFDIADGIRWAAGGKIAGTPDNPHPAKVINLSLGGLGACDAEYLSAIREARQRGATVVVAGGNSNIDAANVVPANCEGVITVAATNRNGARAKFGTNSGSNFGRVVKIAAPGGETANPSNGILSTLNAGYTAPGTDSYEFYQGTSMAAPHVAGVVALMYQVHPAMTPDQVLSILQSTSQPFPVVSARQCDTTTCGAGIVDAEAAVLQAAKAASQVASAVGVAATPKQ